MDFVELKQKFMSQIMKHCERSTSVKFDIEIDETGKDYIFWAKGYINFGYEKDGNFRIWELSISEAYFQFPDFEAKLDEKYISNLEKYCIQ